MIFYKVRHKPSGRWADGRARVPWFSRHGGRTWDDLNDARQWVTNYFLHRQLPTDFELMEVVAFEVIQTTVLPLQEAKLKEVT
jgi:hypothetical protein